MMEERTRASIVAFFGVVGAVATVLTVPEIRRALGLSSSESVREERRSDGETKESLTPSQTAPPPAPSWHRDVVPSPALLSPGPPNQFGQTEVAILVQGARLPSDLLLRTTDALEKANAKAVLSLFSPSFLAHERAPSLVDGDWTLLSEARVEERVDAVLILRASTDVVPNPDFEGIQTAALTVEFVCVRAASRDLCGSQRVTVWGAGFTPEAALEDAANKAWADIGPGIELLRF